MSEVFSVELPDALARKLIQAAQARSIEVSEMLSSAVEWFVEQQTGAFTAAEQEEIDRETEALGSKDAVAAVRARRLGMPEYQIETIKAGLAAGRAGRETPQEEVFAKLATKYGW
jgi:predicted transcriptional regulator